MNQKTSSNPQPHKQPYTILLLLCLWTPWAAAASTAPHAKRLTTGWEYVKGDLGGPWEALRAGRSGGLPVWETVTLPHCVNANDAVDPDTAYYQGPAWYRNQIAKDGVRVTDETSVQYETRPWGQPARLALDLIDRQADQVTVRAQLFDDKGVLCLDARDFVRFGLTGDGRLIDNLGTSTGSRKVQLTNGRAQISVQLNQGQSVVSLGCEGCDTAFLTVKAEHKPATPVSLDVGQIDRDRILRLANEALSTAPIALTHSKAKYSEGGLHDFYSNGDYWWPDPDKADGLPYIQRDGESNPDNFSAHRLALRRMRNAVTSLASAYAITREDKYAQKAVALLKVFFLDDATRMNPYLLYAQAIPGRVSGRGIGIIDTLHLVEIPLAILAMDKAPAMTPKIRSGLDQWFGDYAQWMTTHDYGLKEMNAKNNHSVAFMLQLASFATLTRNQAQLALCRQRFKEVFIPQQMAVDGSFPLELKRTKPYGYAIFQLDNMISLCQLLSTPQDNLWSYTMPDGRNIQKAMAYLYPFLKDKTQWPLPHDVQYWHEWPVRQPALLFAGLALNDARYLELWQQLDPDPQNLEVRRNMAVTQPLLWILAERTTP